MYRVEVEYQDVRDSMSETHQAQVVTFFLHGQKFLSLADWREWDDYNLLGLNGYDFFTVLRRWAESDFELAEKQHCLSLVTEEWQFIKDGDQVKLVISNGSDEQKGTVFFDANELKRAILAV